MATTARKDRAWLLAAGRSIAKALKSRSEGTRLRIRIPRRATQTNTDGWCVAIGDLGRGQPRLEIWFDRFSGYKERRLFACIHSGDRRKVTRITERVSKRLWPVRVFTNDDTDTQGYVHLARRLTQSDFHVPVLERYPGGKTFYGFHDPARGASAGFASHFGSRAAAFFEDLARSLPNARASDLDHDVYPQIENRKIVASHLTRERSKYLAVQAKIRDDHRCRICRMKFDETYGEMGRDFAEAHHIVPLSRLKEGVRTDLGDLITVCANCHRMLHRMLGQHGDIRRLQVAVRRRRPRRR